MIGALLFIVSAPSGAGKTSLVNALVDGEANLVAAISHTTRPIRPGERDGVNYHFIETERFQQMIKDQAFLEYAQVFDHWYGTSRDAVEAEFARGNDVILEIDWQGAQQIRANQSDCISIFILPPSLEALRTRLTCRGEDQPAVIERRMRDALSEISHYRAYDYLVINDQFDCALADLKAIVRCGRLKTARQSLRLSETLKRLVAKAVGLC